MDPTIHQSVINLGNILVNDCFKSALKLEGKTELFVRGNKSYLIAIPSKDNFCMKLIKSITIFVFNILKCFNFISKELNAINNLKRKSFIVLYNSNYQFTQTYVSPNIILSISNVSKTHNYYFSVDSFEKRLILA